jgi:hypothetical protein
MGYNCAYTLLVKANGYKSYLGLLVLVNIYNWMLIQVENTSNGSLMLLCPCKGHFIHILAFLYEKISVVISPCHP